MSRTRTDLICVNDLSVLHGVQAPLPILFCKTDYLHEELSRIGRVGQPCILVSGNSDYCIGHPFHPYKERLPDLIPQNVLAMFSQNCLVPQDHPAHSKCFNIPIGIENFVECKRLYHGFIPVHGPEKYGILCGMNKEVSPSKFVYSNFTVREACQSTDHRILVRQISQESPHIDWEEPNLTSEEFYKKVLEYDAIVCAQGNGPGDNHRIYEVLYLGRIPITFNTELYRRLHHNFPIVCLSDPNALRDRDYLEKQIQRVKKMTWNREMLYSSYWKNLILSECVSKMGVSV